MADIKIYDGTPNFLPGSTPFGTYDREHSFQRDIESTTIWCANRLGYPIVDIEMQDTNFFACFEEAITEYSSQVNRFNIRENLLTAQGNSTASNFTHRNITPNLGRLIGLSKQYGSEVGSGGTVDWKHASIKTVKDQQVYDLDTVISAASHSGADIEIKRVFHQASPASSRFYDPQFGTNVALNAFGWSGTLAGVSYLSLPLYDDLLKIQEVEFSDTVRKSMYSFELINNKLRIHPTPLEEFDFYLQYILTADRDTLISEAGVSDYSNMRYDNMLYANINAPGKQWIKKYTLALAKTLLGQIRSKYASLPIPGAEVNVDGDTLRSEGAAEQEILLSQLREDLEATSKRNMLEAQNDSVDFQQNMLNKAPLNIYIG
tara:strand:- start:257 stop:1381 length:1125 start_codon:yes stop_codon:yes gene_type:complete